MSEFITCPFCHLKAASILEIKDGIFSSSKHYQAECSGCYAHTSIYKTKEAALEAWNTLKIIGYKPLKNGM